MITRRGARAPLLAVLLAGSAVTIIGRASTPALAAESAAPQAPAVIPPTLQALEQKLGQIRFNTARVVVRSVLGEFRPVTVGGELAAGGSDSNRLLTTTRTALSYSPRASVSTSTLDGGFGEHALHRKLTERLIGRSLDVDIPALARSDGGRPWVRSQEHAVAKPYGAAEGEPLAAVFEAFSPTLATVPQPGEHGTFASLSQALGVAQSITQAQLDRLEGKCSPAHRPRRSARTVTCKHPHAAASGSGSMLSAAGIATIQSLT